ncbi:MAG: hypothetical protein PHF86_09435 [Candidatus Nanoarchaeia archaeon]|jgi:hypothetical protein|nr:hypothetical protein [Candidatus Nanoarchaeia archaeon]
MNNVLSTREVIINIEGGTFGTGSMKDFDIEGNEDIYSNKTSFWVHECIFGLNCKIHKETFEGKKLLSMIESKCPLSELKYYIDFCVLKQLDVETVYALLEKSKVEAFEKGKRERSNEIKKLLDIEEGPFYSSSINPSW